MKIILLIFFCSAKSILLSQSKKIIYVDENYEFVNFSKYKKKFNSELFEVVILSNDTATFKKLKFKEFLGRIGGSKKSQLNKLLSKRYSVDTNKVWLFHFLDSVPNIKKMPNKSRIKCLDSTISWLYTNKGKRKKLITSNRNGGKKNMVKHRCIKHKHLISLKDYIKKINDENKNINKNTELIHLYKLNKGFPKNQLNTYNYFEDKTSILSNIFNDGIKSFKTIIIYPDGNYYTSNFNSNHFNKEKKLTRKKTYKRYKRQWNKKLASVNK
ncbi:hypothetical protein [Lutibacter sp. Hel_I_33_5]|uniref:hypothetical protein n=1 Tax=Lutibacter sp. Hel_I_33_5 TaxID=1566289 RepID=UPI0011A42DE5|nr:hypothetical protein [Lutibacter sp. Hel_I_33_5]